MARGGVAMTVAGQPPDVPDPPVQLELDPAQQPAAQAAMTDAVTRPARRGGGLLRSTTVFSAMTLLSRVAGLARDMLQGRLFGASAAMDAFIIAYRIPNYLRRIFAEGSMQMAFVPVLNELRERGDQAALKDFIDRMAGTLFAVVLAVCGLGMLLAPWVARVFAFGAADDEAQIALIASMLRITFPYLLFISMMALTASVLNSYGKFALPAVTPVLHNLTVIAAMLFLTPCFPKALQPKALAWGVLIAGVVQFLVLWPSLRKLGLRPWPKPGFGDATVRRVVKLMGPTLFSSSVAQLNLLVGTGFAAALATGSQTWLYSSDRLVELPLGLFGVAIGTVILPHLSRRHAASDTAGYSQALDWGLRLSLLLGVPAALGLLLLAVPVSSVVYEGMEFTAHDSRMVAISVAAMSVAIPAFMLSKVLSPAFYARQDSKTPMRAAIWTVLLNVVLTIAFTAPLWYYRVEGAHGGIALATSLAGIANAVLLWRYLRRDGLLQLQPGWGAFLARLAAACALLTAAVLGMRGWMGEWTAIHGFWLRLSWLLAAIAAGAVAYGAGLLLTGLRPRHLRF